MLIYLLAEILGAILASFFIFFIFGNEMNLGANAPNYTEFPIYVIVGIEIFASALLMLVILIVVYTKELKKFGGLLIGATVGLDVFLFGLISGVSMNPARSLAPAVVSGYYIDFMALSYCTIYWNYNCRITIEEQILVHSLKFINFVFLVIIQYLKFIASLLN